MSDYCEIGGTDPAFCAHCRGLSSIEEQVVAEDAELIASGTGWFKARHMGNCGHCRNFYKVGTPIRYTASHERPVASCCQDKV